MKMFITDVELYLKMFANCIDNFLQLSLTSDILKEIKTIFINIKVFIYLEKFNN